MQEETFRPRRPRSQEDAEHAAELTRNMQEARGEVERPTSDTAAFAIGGTAPQEFLQAMRSAAVDSGNAEPRKAFGRQRENPNPQQMNPEDRIQRQETQQKRQENLGPMTNEHLKGLLATLSNSTSFFEQIELPSKGRFYDGVNGPADGILSVRQMTGEEEQILATPRFVRRGQAINMIFQRCIKEDYRVENLLSIDRTYLLIYLRGISYSENYQVEVKCPDCERKFETVINLTEMYVDPCPDDYGPILQDVLPSTKLPFSYRLSTGKDEQDITDYRDRRVKNHGDMAADDTLTYRTATLLNEIDGISAKNELQILLRRLPINDVSYIRNCINEPPFGVDTDIEIVCPLCLHDFTVDLPLEADFFFPRRKKTSPQA